MAKKYKAKFSAKNAEISSPAHFNMYLWLIAGAWIFPFLNSYHAFPLPDFYTEWLCLAISLAAMFQLIQKILWRAGLWIPRIVLAPFLLGLVLIVQMLLSRNAYAETVWQAELYLLWAIGLIWLGAALNKQLGFEVVARGLSWAVLLGGLVSALIGLLQYLHWHRAFGFFIAPHEGGTVYGGNLAQANHYANYLSVALAGLGYLFATRRIATPWAMAGGLVLLLGMSLSGSRSTWVYLLLFVMVAHSLYWRSTEQSGKLLRRAALIAVPLYAAVQLAVMYLPHLLALQSGLTVAENLSGAGAIHSVVTQPNLTTGARLADMGSAIAPRWFLWQQAWHMFLDAPLLGIGWGEFTWQFFLRFSDVPNPGVPVIDPNAHNFVLHLLATTGLLGILAILVPLGLWMWRTRGLPVSPEKWWLICILAVQGIHGLLEYNLWYAQFLGIAALLLGLGETAEFRFPAIGKKWLGWAWLTALLLAAIQLAEVMQDYRTLEGWVYNGRNFNPRDPSGSARRMQTDLLDLQAHSLFRPFVELSHPGLVVPASASPAEKLVLDLRVMRFTPNSEVVYRHAMMLASNGEQEAAKKQLERAIAVYPNDLGVFVQRIKILADNQPEIFGTISRIAQEKLNGSPHVQTK